MSGNPTGHEKRARTEILDCLTDGHRRRALRALDARAATVTERELAAAIAPGADGPSPTDGDSDEVERVHVRLRHVDLPMLQEAGLLSWDREAATVTPSDHPVFESPHYDLLLDTDDDQVAEAVADEQRRSLLAVFRARDGAVSRTRLAREICDGEYETAPEEALEAARIRLHHVHLPVLEAADLIEYDADGGPVAYRGPPELLDSVVTDERVFEAPNTDDRGPPLKIP